MILLDTNVSIYLAKGAIDIDSIKQNIIGFASTTKREILSSVPFQLDNHDEGEEAEVFFIFRKIFLSEGDFKF